MYIEVIFRKYVVNERHGTNVQITTSTDLAIPKAPNGKRREPTAFTEKIPLPLVKEQAFSPHCIKTP